MEYCTETFGPEIESAYARLFPEFVEEKARDQLRWRFRPPSSEKSYFILARDQDRGGTIVGMIGLIPAELRGKDGLIPSFQAVDLIVDPAYRGRGVFNGMGAETLRSAKMLGGHVLWGFPNANAAPVWFGRFGWRDFGTVPFLIRPLSTGFVLRKVFSRLAVLNVPLISRSLQENAGFQEIQRFDSRVTDLWNLFSTSVECGVDRTADWLNWRLVDRPKSGYRSVGSYSESGILQAMVSTCVLHKHDSQVCYVMEALCGGTDLSALSRLLNHEVSHAAAKGAEVALAWCPRGAINRAAYLKAGFVPLPRWLTPIEIHFGGRVLDSRASNAAATGKNWYISYLDSDTV